MKKQVNGVAEMHELARTFAEKAVPGSKASIFALYGDLGAGKTAFTQGFARAMGVEDTVTSPTFVLEKIYRLSGRVFERLVHIDAYRLESSAELRELGWEGIANDPGDVIIVEWADRIEDALPAEAVKIRFRFVDENVREVEW